MYNSRHQYKSRKKKKINPQDILLKLSEGFKFLQEQQQKKGGGEG